MRALRLPPGGMPGGTGWGRTGWEREGRILHDVLRLWRLTAVAQSDPGFAGRLAAVREAVQSGSLEGATPIEAAVPGWPGGL